MISPQMRDIDLHSSCCDMKIKLNPFQEIVYTFTIVYLVKSAIYPKPSLKLKSTISHSYDFRRNDYIDLSVLIAKIS